MVQCLMCEKKFPNQFSFILNNKQELYLNTYEVGIPLMLIRKQGEIFDVLCSEKCIMAKFEQTNMLKYHIEEKFDLIFRKSQIKDGIIQKFQILNDLLKQENILTFNVYKKKADLDILELIRQQNSEQIKNIIDNLTNQLIQHLGEAIKFSMSETEKINVIKLQVEKLLNEQGNINLLDHQGHLRLYEVDIEKYKVDQMIQLMDKIMQIKQQINHILSPKNQGLIQNI